ncbi:unnamed protein product [Soboliphyme baturini]|uniref:ShKT domain-containing protein n=1 Tax=Soboliphyme baturini TaxID=241478 RepID=A0A183J6G6_9BILA|nr:unnamed protein product [Soboliphyme baturini]
MPNMRCALYRLLTRFVLVSNAGCPSPIQCAETMFLTGQQDACPNVSRICHDGYSICQRLAKPSVPYSEPLVYRKENIEWHSMDNDESTSLKPTPDAGDSGFNDDNKKTPTEADAKCIFEENEGSHQEVAAQGACDEFQGEETLRLNDRPVADVEDGTDLVLLDKVMRTSGFENHELCRRKLQKKNFCPSDSMSVLYRPPLIDLCDSSPEFNVDPDNQSEQSSELGNTVLGNHKPPEKVESLLDCKSVSQSLESMLKDFVDAPPDKP